MKRLALWLVLAILAVGCAAQAPTVSELESPSSRTPAPSSTGSASPSASASASASASESPVPSHVLAEAIDEELRAELLAMMAEDQAVRTGVAPPGDDRTAEELFAAWDTVDGENAERMREILDEFGWPGWSLVGEDGALAAWVLIQHADLRPDLQRHGLAMMQAAVDAGDADPADLAYLIDRVRVAEGKPQVYGTQLTGDENGELVPRTPIEDEANVDERRAAVGLGTLEEYFEEFRQAMEPSPSATP